MFDIIYMAMYGYLGFLTTMARKKIATTVYLTPEQKEQLDLLHKRTHVPVSVYIREGIDLVLKIHRDEMPGQLTLDVSNDS